MKRNTIRSLHLVDLKFHKSCYELKELIKEFIPAEDFEIINDYVKTSQNQSSKPSKEKKSAFPTPHGDIRVGGADGDMQDISAADQETEIIKIELPDGDMDRNAAKRFIYDTFAELTGYRPEWGTLTGVRPTKMANELMYMQGLSSDDVRSIFSDEYYVSKEKTDLVMDTCENQRFITGEPAGNSAGVYIGIPFCPTRCLYCSFASYQAKPEAMERYLEALLKEVEVTGTRMSELGITAESIYLGGGTPTSLSADAMDRLLSHVRKYIDMTGIKEFCVEAGRPDTITAEKLQVIKANGADRISINPQTMNDSTLELIGRSHRVEDIYRAFEMAKASGIPHINTDLIAGLPGEDYDMFMDSLKKVIELEPSNITVHTLAVKRASKLRELDANYNYDKSADVGRMVSDARTLLAENGYFPYYMYRQKHMRGNFENVSYAKKGTESPYNIRIMDEHQTIIAMGAGGISKAYYEGENRLERVPNVSNFEIYIDRIDEMIQRKEDKLYIPFQK